MFLIFLGERWQPTLFQIGQDRVFLAADTSSFLHSAFQAHPDHLFLSSAGILSDRCHLQQIRRSLVTRDEFVSSRYNQVPLGCVGAFVLWPLVCVRVFAHWPLAFVGVFIHRPPVCVGVSCLLAVGLCGSVCPLAAGLCGSVYPLAAGLCGSVCPLASGLCGSVWLLATDLCVFSIGLWFVWECLAIGGWFV